MMIQSHSRTTYVGGKKVSSGLCINLQLSLRLPRRIPSANRVYGGCHTAQPASGAQPGRSDSCKSSLVAHFVVNTQRNRVPLIFSTEHCHLKRTVSALPVIWVAGRSGGVG